MHQSIPAKPIPPRAVTGHVVGHLAFCYCPRAGQIAFPRDDILMVLASCVAENANMACIEDFTTKDDNFVVE